MKKLKNYLINGDLRSIGNVNKLLPLIKNQNIFDELFEYLFSNERLIVMRAADAIEKVTLNNEEYLHSHKIDLINFLEVAQYKEFKWHLALLISRIPLSNNEIDIVWKKLKKWAKDKKESKIVRVNSIQSMFYLASKNIKFKRNFDLTIKEVEIENIASINARIRKLKLS